MEGRRKAALTAAGILVTCVFLFPLYWMVATSLRDRRGILFQPVLFPSRIVFDSYILKNEHMGSACSHILKTVLWFLFGATALTLVLGFRPPMGWQGLKAG